MLEIKNVSKSFADNEALKKVSFCANDGEITGLVGQNGAGKSTILRIIMHFISASQGEICYQNQKVTQTLYNEIGFLPEERSLFINYTIQDQLVYFARLHGLKKRVALERMHTFLELFEVKGTPTTKIKMLSKGNQQKVQLIAALIHNPELIILDEPFSGLDPVNADIFMRNILALKAQGKMIIFSSHNMNNVEYLCDKVVMLKNGSVVLNNDIHTIKSMFGRTKLSLWSLRPPSFFAQIPGVAVKKHDPVTHMFDLQLSDAQVGKKVYSSIEGDGYKPVFNQNYPTLAEIFTRKVNEDDHGNR
ncbi:ATP-binding cassette domain-containing protein [Bombilactobacillus folatiphilus]|uniref:ATP-binding cassette domain-containing protein n=1 Tax=Bombilactobacillus folatiphilus TaxID=2923362 RepID=A0ABY4P747_9LACO|nr:ATP-binding cassette domain-containing protein [Bombilactobacillus folatiphilus]UQS81442.1 ATP-binding cassette domain-containing protein [Bombilactobacillus folatiphilus]